MERGPLNFVYIPYSTGNLVAGRVGGSGAVLSGTAGFSVASVATGIVRLDIDGYAPADGTLIVSSENDGNSVDDFNTYAPEGDHWIIENRDLPDSVLGNPASGQFVFAFFPFDNPPSRPGGLVGVTAWAAGYGLGGTNTIGVADPDGDGFNNLYEYALGGDPTNPAEWGIDPVASLGSAGGIRWLDYVHLQRSGAGSGLSYNSNPEPTCFPGIGQTPTTKWWEAPQSIPATTPLPTGSPPGTRIGNSFGCT